MKNQVLKILAPNEATGYKIIQLAGWTGTCFLVPRTELRELGKREEMKNPGVYFLFGENDESTNQKLYIGESEKIFNRILNHDANKNFWNVAIIFTGDLDKAKIKYLEFLSTSEAHSVNRFDLLNTISPKQNHLSEFDLVSTQDYFTKISYILTVFGYPVFQHIEKSIVTTQIYFLKIEGGNAKSQLLDDGSLNVLEGSLARIKETDTFPGSYLTIRKKLIESGTLKDAGDKRFYVFTKNVLFKSPSSAAGVVTGRSINGWTAWKDEKGNSLDDNLRK